jgi:hypothetical protein
MDNATKAVLYILFNMCSSLGIVFANKAVFAVFHFPYPFLLTLIHIIFTAVGMQVMASVRTRASSFPSVAGEHANKRGAARSRHMPELSRIFRSASRLCTGKRFQLARYAGLVVKCR